MSSAEQSGDDGFQVVRTGAWRSFSQRLPRPAFAFGANNLYLVSLEGSDFVLAFGESTRPVVGFFTHRIVAARTEDAAKLKSSALVLEDWRERGYERRTLKLPALAVNEIERLSARFRLRSGAGFTFHRGD